MSQRVAATLIAVLVMAAPARAQQGPFGDLGRTADEGDAVIVTDASDRDWKGRLLQIRPDEIVLTNGERVSFGGRDVRRIRRADGLWNGALLGAAIGAAGIPLWQRASCGSNDSECATIVGGVGLVTLVPAGAVVGLIVDKLVMRTIYLAPDRKPLVGVVTHADAHALALSVGVAF